MNSFKFLIALLIILNHTSLMPLFQNQSVQMHRKILDPEIAIDEILPPGVIPLMSDSNNTLFTSNNFLMLAGGLAMAYSATMAHLFYLSYKVNHGSQWSIWHEQESLEEMEAQKQSLAQELISEIRQYYAKSSTPYALFIKDIDREIALFTRFISWHSVLTKLKMGFLFPSQKQTIIEAFAKIKRLEFLKELLHINN